MTPQAEHSEREKFNAALASLTFDDLNLNFGGCLEWWAWSARAAISTESVETLGAEEKSWKLVPTEATSEMLSAVTRNYAKTPLQPNKWKDYYAKLWKKFLKAAPQVLSPAPALRAEARQPRSDVAWGLALLAQTQEFSDEVRMQCQLGCDEIERLRAAISRITLENDFT